MADMQDVNCLVLDCKQHAIRSPIPRTDEQLTDRLRKGFVFGGKATPLWMKA